MQTISKVDKHELERIVADTAAAIRAGDRPGFYDLEEFDRSDLCALATMARRHGLMVRLDSLYGAYVGFTMIPDREEEIA